MSSAHVGYAAMTSRFPPRDMIDYCEYAEQNGFTGTMVADHFQPWLPRQGNAPFVWNLLSSVSERTTGDVGPGVVCPSFKMHPAVVAQASATLAALHPGRHWLGLGSGEALNEHMTGQYWPEAPERIARMWEAIDVIKKLFSGKEVKHKGDYFTMEKSRLWTLDERPPIFVATSGPVTAKRAGRDADGMITPGESIDKVAGLLERFRSGVRESGKSISDATTIVQLHLSWAPTDEEAMANAVLHWPHSGMKFSKADIRSPFDFEQIARLVRPEDLDDSIVVSSDLDVHRAAIQRYLDLGISRIYLHNADPDQRRWIRAFGESVLPHLTR